MLNLRWNLDLSSQWFTSLDTPNTYTPFLTYATPPPGGAPNGTTGESSLEFGAAGGQGPAGGAGCSGPTTEGQSGPDEGHPKPGPAAGGE